MITDKVTETVSPEATNDIAPGTPKKLKITKQMAEVTNGRKPKTHNMLSGTVPTSQQSMRNLTDIERARKNRNRGKRSTRELVESVSSLLRDGKERSVSEIAKSTGMGWATAYWLLDLIEMIQREPFLAREGGMKRKRYYRMI